MKKIFQLSICFVLVGLVSCKKDFLNQPTAGVQTEDNFFESPGAALKTVVKCYQVFNDAYGFEWAMAVFCP